MENELEMIQTLFQYQNYGLIPFPIKPFSKELYTDGDGFRLYKNALSGITISEEEIYEYFGSKKLDNCGLLLGEKGNLSIIEFDNELGVFLQNIKGLSSPNSTTDFFARLNHNTKSSFVLSSGNFISFSSLRFKITEDRPISQDFISLSYTNFFLA